MIKAYQYFRMINYHTSVEVDGKKIAVSFERGSSNNPVKVYPTYITNNPRVQELIEKRKDFGSAITIQWVSGTAPEKPLPVIPDGYTEVKGVSTAVEAKEYLLEKFPDVKHAELRNTTLIKEFADKNKIVFTDLA